MKEKKYFIVWIEGLSPEHGEKIERFNGNGEIEYTLEMTKAMRVRQKDIPMMKRKLERLRIAMLENPRTFTATSYAPKGTIFGTDSFFRKQSPITA